MPGTLNIAQPGPHRARARPKVWLKTEKGPIWKSSIASTELNGSQKMCKMRSNMQQHAAICNKCHETRLWAGNPPRPELNLQDPTCHSVRTSGMPPQPATRINVSAEWLGPGAYVLDSLSPSRHLMQHASLLCRLTGPGERSYRLRSGLAHGPLVPRHATASTGCGTLGRLKLVEQCRT